MISEVEFAPKADIASRSNPFVSPIAAATHFLRGAVAS